VADPPQNLQNNPAITTATQIGITWADGDFDGGKEVTDYRITYDQGFGDFVTLQQGVTAQFYIVTGLTTGLTYSFRVQSKNEEGYSDYSNTM
jgi:hypothetical protein